MTTVDELMDKLYGKNIWNEVIPLPYHMEQYNDWSNELREIMEETWPSVIVELGSWYGFSAITMAAIADEIGLGTTIICIDNWLGSIEHWHPKNRHQLMIRDGYPTIYRQFMSNVKHMGHSRTIMPIPMGTLAGLRWLEQNGVEAGLIYVDASHDSWDVYADLKHAYEILGPRGVICGDDYYWDSVKESVDRFADELGFQVSSNEIGYFWRSL